MTGPLAPGSTIGILGAGQLGRMLAMAAADLGFETVTLSPETDPPAALVARRHIVGAYDDEEALEALAEAADVITYEFENVPAASIARLIDSGAVVRPDAAVLEVCQDRLSEKRFLRELGMATAPFAPVSDLATLQDALSGIGVPAILKTRRFGYDGKGQFRIDADDEAILKEALTACGDASILEGMVRFDAEISQVAARGTDGAVRTFDVPHNLHRDGILRTSRVPAPVPEAVRQEAAETTTRLLDRLRYVGVLTVEFFWSRAGGLIANEIAPRVHNSGHWTREACRTCQFTQHIRAVAGWPLGDPGRIADAEMDNLIGPEADDWQKLSGEADRVVTLYGKREARPGRKMGHTVRVWPKGQGPAPEDRQ